MWPWLLGSACWATVHGRGRGPLDALPMSFFSYNIFLQFSGQCAGTYDCGFCWLSMQRRGNEEFPRAERVRRSRIHSNEMAHKHPRATYRDYSDSVCDCVFRAPVDINIVCHLISAGKRAPKIGAHVTLWFLTGISSPPVMAYRIINFSGPKHFNSGCRHLSSYQ